MTQAWLYAGKGRGERRLHNRNAGIDALRNPYTKQAHPSMQEGSVYAFAYLHFTSALINSIWPLFLCSLFLELTRDS